jgi:hypothetical protein
MLAPLPLGTRALGWLLAAWHPVYAQPLPIPVAPPLPIPTLPIPEFRAESALPNPAVRSESPTEPGVSADFDAMWLASSKAEREALLRSQFHESWYGWQTLGVDAAAVGMFLLDAAIVTSRPPLPPNAAPAPRPVAFAVVSTGVYALGPSAVHFAHGNLWGGFGSIGLRVVMPLAGFAFGYLASGALRPGTGSALGDGTVGGFVGGAGAMAADAAALAWDRWHSGPPEPRALLSGRASF